MGKVTFVLEEKQKNHHLDAVWHVNCCTSLTDPVGKNAAYSVETLGLFVKENIVEYVI